MKNQIIICFVVLFLIGLVSAIPLPHAFYGNVYYSDGTPIQENLIITAKLGDFNDSSVIKNGKYGYEDTLIVKSESTNGTVYFYIDGLNEPIKNYTFKAFEITKLDFTTDLEKPVNGTDSEPETSPEDSDSSGDRDSSSSSNSGFYESSAKDNLITLNYETESLKESDTINLNKNLPETGSGITGSVINFVESGKGIMALVALIGILALIFIIKKKK